MTLSTCNSLEINAERNCGKTKNIAQILYSSEARETIGLCAVIDSEPIGRKFKGYFHKKKAHM